MIRRTVFRACAGALALALSVSLGVASAAPAAKSARSSSARSDSVLVRIGKETITSGMVQRRIEELPEHLRAQFTTGEGRQRLLDRIVEERVWLLTATRKGVADRPEIRRQIEQQRRDLLIRTYINEVMATNPAPADSEVRAYYDEHKDDYKTPASVTMSHVQLKTENEAKKVRQLARTGQDWMKLAAKYSVDTLTKARGGALGPTTRDGLLGALGRQPAMVESAFAVGEGKIAGPIKSDLGWHVIRVDGLRQEGMRDYDQVRTAISRQLGSKRSQDYYQAKLAEAKASLGVRADSNAIHSFMSRKKTAREAFNEAQSAGAAEARIEAYQKVVGDYPDSDVSPQAAFMVGFIQSEELKDYDAAQKSFQALLARYPKSELAASARWMLDHMRSESAPEFMNLESDSTAAGAKRAPTSSATPKTPRKGTGKP